MEFSLRHLSNMMRVRFKLILFICNVALVASLLFYFVVPTPMVGRLTIKDYRLSRPLYIFQVSKNSSPTTEDNLLQSVTDKLPEKPLDELPEKIDTSEETAPRTTPTDKVPEELTKELSEKPNKELRKKPTDKVNELPPEKLPDELSETEQHVRPPKNLYDRLSDHLPDEPDNLPDGPLDNLPDGHGPPDNLPNGPPDSLPHGPPDNVPDGPPDNVPDIPAEKLPRNLLEKSPQIVLKNQPPFKRPLTRPPLTRPPLTRTPPTRKPPPFVKLPQSVIDRVKTFVFFIGHGSSGHSIIGSLLDSHPHMVVTHEFTLFQRLSTGSLAPTKPAIFNALWNCDKNSKYRMFNQKGYTLIVRGLYEGRYLDHIDVIGDKRGDNTIQLFLDQPGNWSSVYNVLQSLNVTLKVIHVIRNPYDNIASMLFLSDVEMYKNFRKIKLQGKMYTFNSSYTAEKINKYFRYHQAIANVRKKYNLDVLEVHGKDLILDPRGTLVKLCIHLGVTCTDDYLRLCTNKIYKRESRTRLLVDWTKQQLEEIQHNIEKYKCLQGYDFDSM